MTLHHSPNYPTMSNGTAQGSRPVRLPSRSQQSEAPRGITPESRCRLSTSATMAIRTSRMLKRVSVLASKIRSTDQVDPAAHAPSRDRCNDRLGAFRHGGHGILQPPDLPQKFAPWGCLRPGGEYVGPPQQHVVQIQPNAEIRTAAGQHDRPNTRVGVDSREHHRSSRQKLAPMASPLPGPSCVTRPTWPRTSVAKGIRALSTGPRASRRSSNNVGQRRWQPRSMLGRRL